MAQYATLKASIQNVIKQNGNNEITGDLLQQALMSMVNSLGVGYQYAGIATPETEPGTPDQQIFYIAGQSGTYTNFNGLTVSGSEIAILYFNTQWNKARVIIPVIFESVINSTIDPDNFLDNGKYNANGTYVPNPYRATTGFYRVKAGMTLAFLLSGTITNDMYQICAFDKNLNFVAANSVKFVSVQGTYTVPAGIEYLRFTHNPNGTTDYVRFQTGFEMAVDNAPTANSKKLLTSGAIYDALANAAGNDVIEASYLSERINEAFGLDLFTTNGYYRVSDGAFVALSARKTTPFIRVYPGMSFINQIEGTAEHYIVCAFDSGFNLIPNLSVPYTELARKCYIVPDGVSYLRFTIKPSVAAGQRFILSLNITNPVSAQVINFNSLRSINSAGFFDIIKQYLSIKPGDNLLSNEMLIPGYYLAVVDGKTVFYGGSSYQATTKIPVEPETTYNLFASLGSAGTTNIFYDENGDVISSFSGDYTAFKTFTTPENCYYVAFSLLINTTNLCLSKTTNQPFYPLFGYTEHALNPTSDAPISSKAVAEAMGTKDKIFGADFRDLSILTAGTGWTIAANGKTAQSAQTGYANRLYYPINTFEDCFNLSADIIPLTGDANGYYEIAIGKFANLSGTMLTIGKDANGGFLAIYSINASGVPVLWNKYTYTNALRCDVGKKLSVLFEKYTTTDGYFNVTITDEIGNKETKTALHPGTYAWGQISFYAILGTCKISNLAFGYTKDLSNIKLAILGHSFIEGNSISGQKNKRFAALLQQEIGEPNVIIYGHGGEGIYGALGYFSTELGWIKSTRYVLVCLGTNDADSAGTCANAASLNEIIQSNGCRPIWLTISPTVDGQQKPILNQYIKDNFEYIDIDPIFYEADGTTVKTDMLLPDGVHPSIAGHQAIFDVVSSQLRGPYNI